MEWNRRPASADGAPRDSPKQLVSLTLKILSGFIATLGIVFLRRDVTPSGQEFVGPVSREHAVTLGASIFIAAVTIMYVMDDVLKLVAQASHSTLFEGPWEAICCA
jgi:hypothetical protein